MNKQDKEIYEKKIAESLAFSLDKDTVAYANAVLELKKNLYLYVLSWNEEKYMEYGLEIMDVATRCINNYNAEEGIPFIHYFNNAWKKEYGHALGRKTVDESYGGVHFTKDDKAKMYLYRKIEQAAVSKGIDVSSNDFFAFVSDSTGWDIEECYQVSEMVHGKMVSEHRQGDDGEDISLFDTIADTNTADKDIEERDAVVVRLTQIEEVFIALQDRQKPLISSLMTARLLGEMGEYILSQEIPIGQYSFFDVNIVRSYIRFGTLPSQKDIAQLHGKLEASVSRSLSTFLNTLKEHIK